MRSEKSRFLCMTFVLVMAGLLAFSPMAYGNEEVNTPADRYINHIYDRALLGQGVASEEFGVGSLKEEIVNKWGQPDTGNMARMFYQKKNIEFALADNRVDGVRTFIPFNPKTQKHGLLSAKKVMSGFEERGAKQISKIESTKGTVHTISYLLPNTGYKITFDGFHYTGDLKISVSYLFGVGFP